MSFQDSGIGPEEFCVGYAQALQCLVSTLRSLVEWFMLCTPVAVVNDTPSAPDDSLRPDWGKLTSSTGQATEEDDGQQPEGEVEVPMPGRTPD